MYIYIHYSLYIYIYVYKYMYIYIYIYIIYTIVTYSFMCVMYVIRVYNIEEKKCNSILNNNFCR